MRGATLLSKCLVAHGAKFVLGVPGHESIIMKSFMESGIHFITTRHEQAAAFAADAAGRLCGHPSVLCYSTFGPGATNLLTGVASAFLDRSPLIAFSPQIRSNLFHPSESHQGLDLISIFKPITKETYLIKSLQEIPEVVASAFRVAISERPGPVFISAHLDLLEQDADIAPEYFPRCHAPEKLPHPKESRVRAIVQRIKESRFPVLVLGGIANRLKLSHHLLCFVEKTGIPVISTFAGKSSFPESHRSYLGCISSHDALAFDDIMARVDLVIMVGFDGAFGDTTAMWERLGTKTVIHITSAESVWKKKFCPDLELICDPGILLDRVCAITEYYISEKYHSFISAFSEGRKAKLYSVATDESNAKNYFITLSSCFGDDDIIVVDVGIHKHLAGIFFKRHRSNTILFSDGLSSAGFALPASLGAKLVSPDSEIICVTGDGGLLMNVQDIETSVREHLKIIIILFADNEYGLIRQYQKANYNFNYGTSFRNPDFRLLCDAFGISYLAVSNVKEIPGAIDQARTWERTCLVHIRADYDYSKLI